MKTLLITALLPLLVITAHAQCDNPFYVMEEGRTYELSSYNGKDKLEAKSQYTVREVNDIDGGYEAVLDTKTVDKKDKLIAETEAVIRCVDNMLQLDFERMLNSLAEMQNIEGAEMSVEGDHIIIPPSLSVGDILPESHTEIAFKMGETNIGKMTVGMTMSDREVVGQEDITTPAGTFSCYKITHNMTVETNIMGMNRTSRMMGTEWIAEGVGVVRSEQHSDKGKLDSYSLLTAVE